MYVIMITPNKFPNGDAGAIRDYHFAKLYQDMGYYTVYIGKGNNRNGNYRGIEYYNIEKSSGSLVNKITNAISYREHLQRIYSIIEEKYGAPNLIHIYSIPKGGIDWAIECSAKNEIPLIHDSVEWYSACEFKYGIFSYPYILKNLMNRIWIKAPIRVIAISTYLEKHFASRGLRTVRIPVIMDSRDYNPSTETTNDLIRIVYAGSPAGKDYLKECLVAFNRLDPEIRGKMEFTIFGADSSFVKACLGNSIPQEIKVLGRVARNQVIEKLQNSDFSILLRPENKRYTKAGFPTKVVEAMMNGCAMICNITSDLGLFLSDKNAIIVSECSVQAMESALIKISKLSRNNINQLKISSRMTAEEAFDYRKYRNHLEKLIHS